MPNILRITMPGREREKFKKWTSDLWRINDIERARIMHSVILNMDRRAKMFAPVDKGLLRSSIRPKLEIRDSNVIGSVYVTRKYAPYQEFGTRTRHYIPNDANDYGMNPADYFVANPKKLTNVRPNPFLLPAARLAKKELTEKIKAMGFKEK